jgi:hypothetical protein
MFASFFLLTASLTKGLTKAVAMFFSIVSFGSAIDKTLGITWHQHSDVLLMAIAFGFSLRYYVRQLRG